MRPIWSGSISFGLLQVPVQLFSATRDLDLHFRLLDGRDKKPIRYERVNTETGEEVPWKDIVRAYQVHKNDYLVVDDDEIKAAAPEQTEAIDIEAFVDRCEVDPIYFEKPYLVAPAGKTNKSYLLLHRALAETQKLGIARVVIRTRQYLAALHAEPHALMLTLMRFDQELVSVEDAGLEPKLVAGKQTLKPAELEMAKKLLESMSTAWKPGDYKDEFRTKLRAILEKRATHGKTVHEAPRAPKAEAGKVLDLVAVLERSLKERGSSRSPQRPAKHHRPTRQTKATARRRG